METRNTQQPYAIILGLDDVRGVYVARTLARFKVPVIAIAKDPLSAGRWTRKCEKIIFANTDNDEFIKVLEELGPTLSQKAVLYPCFDTTLLLISRYRERLQQWYHVVQPTSDVVEMMIDKVQFYTYAQKEGFPIPKTFFLSSRADVDRAAQELTFPCIVKPPGSKHPDWQQHTHLKALKASSADELLEFFNEYRKSASGTLIAQEWVEGPDANLYVCHCYFSVDSEPLVTFTSRKLRQWPPETGEVCLAEECRNDFVRETAVSVFRSVNYRGIGYLEMKKDERSGKHYIMEPNLRLSGRAAIAEASGVELLYTMYCDTIGQPLPENRQQRYLGTKWVYLRRDVQSSLYYLRQGQMSLRQWWQSWQGRKAYAMFSWSDPGPFFGDLFRGFRLLLSAKEREKRDFSKPLITSETS